jgi:CheY-like chemotaxis protein
MARVLVVEDEAAVLLFAEIVLEGLGHSIVSTSSQTGALALLDTDDLDVLFTDIRLPEMKALYVDGAAMLPKPYTDNALKDALEGVLSAA